LGVAAAFEDDSPRFAKLTDARERPSTHVFWLTGTFEDDSTHLAKVTDASEHVATDTAPLSTLQPLFG